MLVSIWTIILVFKGQKDIMVSENRVAKQIPTFGITKFINNSYQKDLEDSLNDQFIKGESFKTYLIGFQNTLYHKVYSNMFSNQRNNSYYSVSKGYMEYY